MDIVRRSIIPLFSVIGFFFLIMTLVNFEGSECTDCWPVEANLMLSYVLIGVITLAWAAAFVTGILSKPDSVKQIAISVGSMAVILGISYVLASDEFIVGYPEDTSAAAIKWSGTGLIMLYILMGLSIASIIYAGVARILNR